MGLIRLKKDTLDLASRTQFHADDLHLYKRDAAKMLAAAEKWAKDQGYVVKKKVSFLGSKLSKMTTTYYKEIRVGDGWDKYSLPKKATIFTHEIVHAKQWRHYGRAKFALSYIGSAKFRWAMEVQAYSESVRAYKVLGANQDWLKNYATKEVPDMLWKNYTLGVLHKGDVYKHTAEILLKHV